MSRPAPARHLGLASGIGIVISAMVGAGVFLSAGYMSQDLGPLTILVAWVIGAGIALTGVVTYSQVARWVPRSGGEYRFLAELVHPALGYLAGWGSLLVGFSAPVAINALAAGSFAAIFVPLEPKLFALGWIVTLTALHAAGLRSSRWTQNALVILDLVLLAGFVAVGVGLGSREWPTWQPTNEHAEFPVAAFVESLFFVAYAFAGWNTSVYVASEFRHPERDAPRAMLLGTAGVALLYLVVNWVFVANLSPEQGRAVFAYEESRVTLGHLVVRQLVGEAGGVLMSVLVICAFTAAASAYTLAGPRVYSEMARDGFLPAALIGREGRPPVVAVLVQGALALAIVQTHTLREALSGVGAILTLFSALVALSVFRVAWRPGARRAPGVWTLLAAGAYVTAAAVMLYIGFRSATHLGLWVGGLSLVGLAAYALTPTRRPS